MGTKALWKIIHFVHNINCYFWKQQLLDAKIPPLIFEPLANNNETWVTFLKWEAQEKYFSDKEMFLFCQYPKEYWSDWQ